MHGIIGPAFPVKGLQVRWTDRIDPPKYACLMRQRNGCLHQTWRECVSLLHLPEEQPLHRRPLQAHPQFESKVCTPILLRVRTQRLSRCHRQSSLRKPTVCNTPGDCNRLSVRIMPTIFSVLSKPRSDRRRLLRKPLCVRRNWQTRTQPGRLRTSS